MRGEMSNDRLGVKRLVRALVHRVGHRGAALLFFALLDAVYAYSLFDPPSSARTSMTLVFIADVAPLQFWGTLWGVAGATCLVSAFLTRDRWGFTAAMLVKVMWGVLYLYGSFVGVERAYIGAAVWLCLAGWVGIISSWPQPADREA